MGRMAVSLGLLLMLGCTQEPGPLTFDDPDAHAGSFIIHVTAGEFLPTVANVTWDWAGDELDAAWLEISLEGTTTRIVDAGRTEAGYSCTVLGLKPLTDYSLKARMVDGATRYASNTVQLATGGLPTQIPDTELDIDSDAQAIEGFIVTSFITLSSTAVILDRDGDVVWWHDTGGIEGTVPRASLARDGRSVLYLWFAKLPDSTEKVTQLVRVGLDGTLLETTKVDNGHHDFVELPDGTVAFLSQDSRVQDDGSEVLGDAIVELDTESGDLEQIWSSWDTLTEPPPSLTPDEPLDWTHANALDYDPIHDTYSVSLLALNAIVTIDRETGELAEQVGGLDSDYTLLETSDRFIERQHQFEFLGDHLLVFDNGPTEDMESRAVEFSLDADLGTAKVEWVYTGSQSMYCPVQGDVNRLQDGSTLITWSSAGRQEQVSAQGELLWQLDLEMGFGFGYTTLVEDLQLFGGR
jgi:hypothetical protein